MADDATTAVSDVTFAVASEADRYEARQGDDVVGLLTWRDEPGYRILDHTEVRTDLQGQGLGTELVEFALRDIRSRGLYVVPACSMVADYLSEHPDQADLIGPGA